MQALVDRMKSEQPIVIVYMFAITQREGFTNKETELFFLVGTIIWQLMRENPNGKRKITERDLNEADQANEDLLEKTASESGGVFFNFAGAVALRFEEPEVFRYMVDAIMGDDEGNSERRPFTEKHLGAAFLHLKILLDALIANQR